MCSFISSFINNRIYFFSFCLISYGDLILLRIWDKEEGKINIIINYLFCKLFDNYTEKCCLYCISYLKGQDDKGIQTNEDDIDQNKITNNET